MKTRSASSPPLSVDGTTAPTAAPLPGTPEELQRFVQLQASLRPLYERLFPDPHAPRTVLVVPSLSMDAEVLGKISGVHHYEERLLCMLMLLRLPRTHLIYVTSQPLAPTVVDYYLHLLPGIPVSHARKRLTLMSCHDGSAMPLTRKILLRPRLMRRLGKLLQELPPAHMSCFNTTPLERTLAVRLGVPIYGTDPALRYLGTKSGSRALFQEAGLPTPPGFGYLRDEDDLVKALTHLKRRHPEMRRAVVKLNEGFSGEGNALFSFRDAPGGMGLEQWVRTVLPERLRFEAAGETWPTYRAKFAAMGGIAEAFLEGETKRSPSVQCRIDPAGRTTVISTHDQILGGPSGQIFLGCAFPADDAYRLSIQAAGLQVAEVLRQYGVVGRFGVDFVSVKQAAGWQHYAIEINLRKGGTTHPFMMLQFLIDGAFDAETGLYRTPAGQPRAYFASDNLEHANYRGLLPEDLIDIAVYHHLHFHGAAQQGVVFHLIGALSEFGKLGLVCIGDTPERARLYFDETREVLRREAEQQEQERLAPYQLTAR